MPVAQAVYPVIPASYSLACPLSWLSSIGVEVRKWWGILKMGEDTSQQVWSNGIFTFFITNDGDRKEYKGIDWKEKEPSVWPQNYGVLQSTLNAYPVCMVMLGDVNVMSPRGIMILGVWGWWHILWVSLATRQHERIFYKFQLFPIMTKEGAKEGFPL